MGSTVSFERQEEPDPWWQSTSQDDTESQVPRVSRSTVVPLRIQNESPPGSDNTLWAGHIQQMGNTIECLSRENINLQACFKELKDAHEKFIEQLYKEETTSENYKEEIKKIKRESDEQKTLARAAEMEILQLKTSFVEEKQQLQQQLEKEIIESNEQREKFKTQEKHFQQELQEKDKMIKELQDLVKYSSSDNKQSDETSCSNGNNSNSGNTSKAAQELERFKEELNVKREARQKALAAISAEMERLRTELNLEREAKLVAMQKVEEMSEQLKHKDELLSEIPSLQSQLEIEATIRQRIEEELKERKVATGNLDDNLLDDIERLQGELESEKETCNQAKMENKYLQKQIEDNEQALTDSNEENDRLQMQFESERQRLKEQVLALKEVAAISKQMLKIREGQVTQLKSKLEMFESQMMDRHHDVTAELKQEYENQLENIKALRLLYDDRMKAMEIEKNTISEECKLKTEKLQEELKKAEEVEAQLKDMEEKLTERNQTVYDLQDQLENALDKSKSLSEELSLINTVFTELLLCKNSSEIDLDRMTKLLQENHNLITEITINEDCTETAASLPKLLLDLVNECDKSVNTDGANLQQNATNFTDKRSEETVLPGRDEIISNLPKVWRVLMELLSHHIRPQTEEEERNDSCYKSIDTPSGPRLVISVSKTFIRLKDLILEKKALQRELMNLRQLNEHLETKLNKQQHRLTMVSSELRKTWNVVGRMRTQHQQLHTHEQILRYELQQKRKLLTELKQELEYCREKWERARQKNSESEVEWHKLRKEFASRKKQPLDSFNNSGESGYSDDKAEDSSEDDSSRDPIRDINSNIPLEQVSDQQGDFLSSVDRIISLSCGLEGDSNLETEMFSDPEIISSSPNSFADIEERQSLPDLVSVTEVDSLTEQISSENPYLPEGGVNITEADATPVLCEDHDCPQNEECPTISLIKLLKQQLSYFSRNLEEITEELNINNDSNALHSIFSLPAIQIPDSLFKQLFSLKQSELAEVNDNVLETLKFTTKTPPPLEENKVNGPDTQITDIEQQALQNQTSATTSSVVNEAQRVPETDQKTTSEEKSKRTAEEVLDARAARLKRLEEQAQQLFNKVTRTTVRSMALSNRLEELHEQYGVGEPPPNPTDSPPNERIPSLPITPSVSTSSCTVNRRSSRSRDSSSKLPQGTNCSSDETIPRPPPLPRTLPNIRLAVHSESPPNNTNVLNPPSPPFLPEVLPTRRLPTHIEDNKPSDPK